MNPKLNPIGDGKNCKCKIFSTNLSSDQGKALLDILKIGTSARGARAKAVIAFNPDTREACSGQSDAPKGFSHWLIKFDGVTDSKFGAAHSMAASKWLTT